MRAALPHGLWVPVLPGTRQVTVGGAISADVHGKNHHTKGSFGNHVSSMDLVTADGSVRTLTPEGPESELFWATVGGMGLTGVIVRAKVRLHRTEIGLLRGGHRPHRATSTSLLELLTDGCDDTYGYSAAWFDTTTTGARLGRGVLTRGSLATVDQLPGKLRHDPLKFEAPQLLTFPDVFPNGLANRLYAARVQRALVPQGAAAPARRDAEHHGLLPGARPVRRLEPGVRVAGLPAVPVRHADRARSRRCAGSSRGSRTPGTRPGSTCSSASARATRRRCRSPRRAGRSRSTSRSPPACPASATELDELVLAAGGRLYLAKESRTTAGDVRARLPASRRVAQGPRRRRPRRRLRLRHGTTTDELTGR